MAIVESQNVVLCADSLLERMSTPSHSDLNRWAATSSRATRPLEHALAKICRPTTYKQSTADGIVSDPDRPEASKAQSWTRPCEWEWKHSDICSIARENSAVDGAKVAKATGVNCHVSPTG